MTIIQINLEVYGSLKGIKKNMNNRNPANVTTNDSSSFKRKSNILGNPAADGVSKNAKTSCSIKIFE